MLHNISYEKLYWMTKFRMLLIVLVIIGAFNWGGYAFDYNLVDLLATKVNNESLHIDKIIYISIAISAFLLAIRKDTWLPFLGWTVMPSAMIPLKPPPNNANIKIQIKVSPNAKVIYWAAYGNDKNQHVIDAYKDYSNSGVIMSDANGIAELSIMEGSGYRVPYRTIERHIHYRVFCTLPGMLGPVKTVKY